MCKFFKKIDGYNGRIQSEVFFRNRLSKAIIHCVQIVKTKFTTVIRPRAEY